MPIVASSLSATSSIAARSKVMFFISPGACATSRRAKLALRDQPLPSWAITNSMPCAGRSRTKTVASCALIPRRILGSMRNSGARSARGLILIQRHWIGSGSPEPHPESVRIYPRPHPEERVSAALLRRRYARLEGWPRVHTLPRSFRCQSSSR
jgi:hypothetical protein